MHWPGSKRKIEELVKAHYAGLYAFAYRLSGSAQQAEDLTQETFCQAQAKFRQLREASRARAWLFTILRNLYLHGLRDQRRGAEVSIDSVAELAHRSPRAALSLDPGRLQQALGELPEAFRTPLILFYFEEFSYRDIAEQLNLPLGTVMSRLARAKSWLKSRLSSALLVAAEDFGEAR